MTKNIRPLFIIGFLLLLLVVGLDLTVATGNPFYIYFFTPFSFCGILMTVAVYYGDE